MSMVLEIGPGRGDFLFQMARENPLKTIAAIEYKRKRFEKLVKRIEKNGLNNIRLYLGDARIVLPQEFPDEGVDDIFILFSDPWPKRRHAKHRLFQESFLQELFRILKPEGAIFIAHDDPEYLRQIRELFQNSDGRFVFSPWTITRSTFYADKWEKEGKKIVSFSYRKIIRLPRALSTRQSLGDLPEP